MDLIPEDGTGLDTANSYATVAEGDAYASTHLYATSWTGSTPERKAVALVMASRVLDVSVQWKGKRRTAEQGLAWPRIGAERDGVLFAITSIPRAVKNATIELARLLLANDLTADVEQNSLKALNLGKGALEIDFKDGTDKKRIPSSVGELLEGLGVISSGSSINVRKVTR